MILEDFMDALQLVSTKKAIEALESVIAQLKNEIKDADGIEKTAAFMQVGDGTRVTVCDDNGVELFVELGADVRVKLVEHGEGTRFSFFQEEILPTIVGLARAWAAIHTNGRTYEIQHIDATRNTWTIKAGDRERFAEHIDALRVLNPELAGRIDTLVSRTESTSKSIKIKEVIA
jgi:hypothetical protein